MSTQLPKIIALVAVVVLVVGGITFSLAGDDDGDSGPIIGKPKEMTLSNFEVQGDMIVLQESMYEATPSTSLLLPKAGVMTSIGWNPDSVDHHEILQGDASAISSEVAISYWDSPQYAIVAENYTHAVRMVPAAVALDAPILLWGDTTEEALWTLGTINANEIIVSGNTPLNKYKSRGLTILDDCCYFRWVLDTLVEVGMDTNYLIVTNPTDDEGFADVPHISAFASQLAAFRGAVILTTGSNGTEINDSVHQAYEQMDEHGFTPEFLCMVGDADALRFLHRSFENYVEDGFPEENPVPSDNWYADRDGDPFTLEVAPGRLIGKTLADISYYFHHLIFYESYLVTTSAPVQPLPQQGLDWNNNAMVYCALAAEFDTRSLNEVWKDFYFDGEFDSADDSAPAHGTVSQYPPAVNPVVNEFTRANFIAINADHGNPGSTVTFNADDLMPLHPGVAFAVSCNLGRIDDLDERGYSVESSIAYTFLEMGLNAYIAPTRITYGVISTDTFDPEIESDDNKAGNGLCRLFYECIINNDCTVGEALQYASNTLYNSAEWDEGFNDEEQAINTCVIWEYHCYGDPAFNPYEPVNEGN